MSYTKIDYSEIHGRRSYHQESSRSPTNMVSGNCSAESADPPQQMKEEEIPLHSYKPYKYYLTLVVCVILHVMLSPEINAPASQTPEPPEPSKKSCSDHLSETSTKFSTQDKFFWPAVYHGLEGVLKDESRPSIITFLYNDTKSQEVFKGIVDLTRNCIDPSGDPIVLTGEELNGESVQEDHGVIIEKYKPQLADSQIMLVKDLQDISAVSSRVFHDFCDTYSPIVERYVVYFTLRYTKDDLKTSKTASDLASNLLKRLWDDIISPEVAAALIARVTEQTLFLNAP